MSTAQVVSTAAARHDLDATLSRKPAQVLTRVGASLSTSVENGSSLARLLMAIQGGCNRSNRAGGG